MYEFTSCNQFTSKKTGKPFMKVHYFDIETGYAGNAIVSLEYYNKLKDGIEKGLKLKEGYDRKTGKTFIYVK